MNKYLEASLKLHKYIIEKHWDGQAIVGPDPIGKINWRITRFVKSYTRWLPWKETLAYLQGQSYWIRANLRLFQLTGNDRYLDFVERCSDFIVQKQLDNGAWEHPPIRERKGFISAVESIWACLGLLSAYQKLSTKTYLNAGLKGYEAVFHNIGLLSYKDSTAVNYYAHSRSLVPNVTTMFLSLIAKAYTITQEKSYFRQSEKLIRFLEYSQLQSGELEYAVGFRTHFQCYQYNSFQFMDLVHYYQVTKDEYVLCILRKLANYLATGLTQHGSSRYDCFKVVPEVNYWTGALAAALMRAHELGLGNYLSLSERAYQYLLTRQNPDGGFDYSRRNYGFLHDLSSYPRYQAMILSHLLYRTEDDPSENSPVGRLRQ